MGEFVPTSKGQGNLNTVLGTIGTLGTVAGAMSGCGGLFNNLFGNRNCSGNCGNCGNFGHCVGGCGNFGNTYTDALQAEIAELKAEKYADKAAADSYKASVAMAEKLDDKWTAQLGEVTREVADSRVREAELKGKIECIEKTSQLEKQILEGKINEVAITANSGINTLAATVNCLANTLNQITKVVVPNGAVCPGYGDVKVVPATTTTTATPAAA